MATSKTISAALKLVDAKKENLRKAFEDLQAHSSSLSSFTLTWPDLDSHFTSQQSSLDRKFKIFQSQLEQSQSQPSKPPSPNQPQSQPSKTPPKQPQSLSQTQSKPSSSSVVVKDASNSGPIPARPELKSFCEKMDGLVLNKAQRSRKQRLKRNRESKSTGNNCEDTPTKKANTENQITNQYGGETTPQNQTLCTRCGQSHSRDYYCDGTPKTCYKCGKIGHIAAFCKAKVTGEQ